MTNEQTLLTLQQLEDVYMDGSADEVSGNVDAPTGHFYRVGRQIVRTDSQGFSDAEDFTTVEEAMDDFNRRGIEYASWDSDDDA